MSPVIKPFMSNVRNIYIADIESGWIINRLMQDLATELGRRGLGVTVGPREHYAGEDVLFNSRYLNALPDARACVNSIFITHIDDRIREQELRSVGGKFNSLVCMSPHDAEFVAAVTGQLTQSVGLNLPARTRVVRPVRVAFFSACYDDGRKNESWITDYFKNRPAEYRDSFVFCFLGHDWEKFAAKLGRMNLNYEIYRYSRDLPGEYGLYTATLASMDRLIYPGFDGGAMSVYDAVAAGIEVIASNISYHRGLGEAVRLFDDREGFYRELDALHAANQQRVSALTSRSISAYADGLLAHWNAIANPESDAPPSATSTQPARAEALELFRGHYKALGFSRIRSAVIRLFLAMVVSRPLRRRS